MIKFKVDDAQGTVHEPVRLEATGLNPSANLQYNLGTSTLQYNSVFASSFNGTATKAATLQVGKNFRSGSTAATNNTVAVRDGSGNLVANLFTGTATQAQYADLAEKYTTDQEHPVGTIMTIPTMRDGDMGDAEMIACDLDGIPTGVISDKPAYLMNAEAEGQAVALKGKVKADRSADEYLLSSRNLPWYSIALSTIATNIQGYQFLGMMGSAYLFGLAQANLEINAVQGILIGAFIFVPLFLREKITTITQFSILSMLE